MSRTDKDRKWRGVSAMMSDYGMMRYSKRGSMQVMVKAYWDEIRTKERCQLATFLDVTPDRARHSVMWNWT